MKRGLPAILVLACATGSLSARADEPAAVPLRGLPDEPARDTDRPRPGDPVFAGGLGSPGRTWEIESDGTFSTTRVATGRMAVAGFYRFSNPLTAPVGFVLRVDGALASDTTTNSYSINGPKIALGLRAVTPRSDAEIEFGGRLLMPWVDPDATNPKALRLALAATLSSGIADDAEWLAVEHTGFQIYLMVHERLPIHFRDRGVMLLGVRYGGRSSLAPVAVPTWLGTEDGIVANVYLDAYLGFPRWNLLFKGLRDLDLELGAHTEASLSSIWPGESTLPVAAEPYLLWSPRTWVSVRVFYGWALPAVSLTTGGGTSNPYGLRLTFYVP